LLREAALFTVKEQRCSGRLLLQHLKARGFSIGKDTMYATVLPALEAAGVIERRGPNVPPVVKLSGWPPSVREG
jgi:hypothetical protein